MTAPARSARAVYPGTFDPFTAGHRDLVDRARRLFDHLTVLVAVNGDKQPTKPAAERALDIRAAIPADWQNVTVAAWSGLTATYCHQHDSETIIRGVRNAADAVHEYQLATMNEALGITTLFLPARPELATISSTAIRAASPPT
ncbi:pantetheine-phosphate adenylyltransferase [Actinoplanes sp. KI2]|uniref:pantetheine-phosphate adenylyltransferase n=1 Tax=Actinoplanes sp. KI2 TaxID=2983315 RepID=UPI0021D5B1BA|nr:pantetheine-phosphate adenylyltransferase [Actinoplanes sp. KI2]MCU7722512.1 pantetheine-phosphate adenylyltransferase [Actinoplanes sp. KI2]